MKMRIDFAPPPPKDAPKKEHRKYNRMVRRAYANARKEEKKHFKETLKAAKNGNAEAMCTLYFAYKSENKPKKAQFWREQAMANGISFQRGPGSGLRPEPEPEKYKNINEPKFKVGNLETPYEFDLSDLTALEVELSLAKKVAETTKGDEEKIKKIIEETIPKKEV